MHLIETKQLGKSYRAGRGAAVPALRDVTLQIPQGAIAALAGPSGSGKTTLLALLGALERSTRGQAFFDGHDLSRCSDTELARLRRRMGYVFQDFGLLPGLTVLDNIGYPLIPRGFRRGRRNALARGWLERFGMEECAEKRPDALSGGEQQRVALARALAGDPQVLLADEPTSNLDAAAGERLAETLCALRDAGTTILLATHDRALLELAEPVFYLDHGHLTRGRAT